MYTGYSVVTQVPVHASARWFAGIFGAPSLELVGGPADRGQFGIAIATVFELGRVAGFAPAGVVPMHRTDFRRAASRFCCRPRRAPGQR
jgi:hypothetical protein